MSWMCIRLASFTFLPCLHRVSASPPPRLCHVSAEPLPRLGRPSAAPPPCLGDSSAAFLSRIRRASPLTPPHLRPHLPRLRASPQVSAAPARRLRHAMCPLPCHFYEARSPLLCFVLALSLLFLDCAFPAPVGSFGISLMCTACPSAPAPHIHRTKQLLHLVYAVVPARFCRVSPIRPCDQAAPPLLLRGGYLRTRRDYAVSAP